MQCLQRTVFFTDSEGISTLRCNIRALQENTYRLAGEMKATMTAQGGPLTQLFDAGAVRYMATDCLGDDPADMPCVIAEGLNQVCFVVHQLLLYSFC